MVAGAEVLHHSIPVLDAQYRCIAKGIDEIVDISAAAAVAAPPSPTVCRQATRGPDAVPVPVSASELDLRSSDSVPNVDVESTAQFVPNIRSGSFADIGPRRSMEDEHIRIDDLSMHLGSLFKCPTPSAFYGVSVSGPGVLVVDLDGALGGPVDVANKRVFDGHGGPDAAAFLGKHATRFFFEDADFPRASLGDACFLKDVENSMRKAFLLADLALADDCTISSSSGTTMLTALVLGRLLLVANAGDCRAVLCRKGEAVEMSQDHRPIYAAERKRVEECGGYVDDGYLNGVLSVTRALGDWDMKMPRGSPSPLIAEPEFRQVLLTEDDEFLIIGCDGIWDVMSSQHAVSIVRRGLRRHDNPEQCARELVKEALRLKTFDNLTVIVVCFSAEHKESLFTDLGGRNSQRRPRLKCCSLSAQALCNLQSWLDNDAPN